MNKINLYIFKITNKYLFINLILILSLVIFINLIEIARNLTDNNQNLLNYLFLTLLKIPSIINQIFPFVTIISISFLFRYLINNNELTSMRNIGYSIFDIFLPVAISIFLFGCFNLIFLNPISSNLEKQYEKILNKKNQDMYSIKISSDIMRIKNINDEFGLNFIEIKKIDVNSMVTNNIKILQINNLNKKLILAEHGKIKDKKFYLDNVKVFNIVNNEYIDKNNVVLNLNFSKTPKGLPSGSFGPTTAGRMDSYVPTFQAAGGSMVMLAKGNRSRKVRDSCYQHGGFYLGSIGGVAAKLALESIKKVEILEYPELGMEAIWKIEVENFPAFIIMDDKGNDFFDLS